ncbi:MAG: RNA-binding protein [Syntrophales bacterium]|nr:RNA-binding protein [Syntrophales bacterium]
MNIYVGNLSFSTTEEALKKLFDEFGNVETAKVIKDNYTGRSKGFGFVEMPDNSEADKAIKALNGKLIEGKNIKVNQAETGGKKRQKKTFRRRSY